MQGYSTSVSRYVPLRDLCGLIATPFLKQIGRITRDRRNPSVGFERVKFTEVIAQRLLRATRPVEWRTGVRGQLDGTPCGFGGPQSRSTRLVLVTLPLRCRQINLLRCSREWIIWGTQMSLLVTVCDFVCTYDDRALSFMGISPSLIHPLLFTATMASTTLFFATWLGVFPLLRRHGIGQPVWKLVLWFVLLVGLFQVVQFILPSLGYKTIPCPYSSLVPAALASLFCLVAYLVHLRQGNRGSAAEFLTFVVGPAVGETVFASKPVAVFMVRLVYSFLT